MSETWSSRCLFLQVVSWSLSVYLGWQSSSSYPLSISLYRWSGIEGEVIEDKRIFRLAAERHSGVKVNHSVSCCTRALFHFLTCYHSWTSFVMSERWSPMTIGKASTAIVVRLWTASLSHFYHRICTSHLPVHYICLMLLLYTGWIEWCNMCLRRK